MVRPTGADGRVLKAAPAQNKSQSRVRLAAPAPKMMGVLLLRVSWFPAAMVKSPPGFAKLIWFQDVFAPRFAARGPVTVLSKSATSALPGTTPFVQLEARFRLSALLALVRVAA